MRTYVTSYPPTGPVHLAIQAVPDQMLTRDLGDPHSQKHPHLPPTHPLKQLPVRPSGLRGVRFCYSVVSEDPIGDPTDGAP